MNKKLVIPFCVYSILFILLPLIYSLLMLVLNVGDKAGFLNVAAFVALIAFILWSLIDFLRLKSWAYYFQVVFTGLQIFSIEGDFSFSLGWSVLSMGLSFQPRIASQNIILVVDMLPLILFLLLLFRVKNGNSIKASVPGTQKGQSNK